MTDASLGIELTRSVKLNLTVNSTYSFAIVAAQFNDFITTQLVTSAKDGLGALGVPGENVDIYQVPGAMEIPIAAKWLVDLNKYDAIICLGSVIRGATTHYEVVIEASSNGVSRVALDSGVPVIFGVLTTENIEQAIERSEPSRGNKGYEFAATAIAMVNLKNEIANGNY